MKHTFNMIALSAVAALAVSLPPSLATVLASRHYNIKKAERLEAVYNSENDAFKRLARQPDNAALIARYAAAQETSQRCSRALDASIQAGFLDLGIESRRLYRQFDSVCPTPTMNQ